MDCSSKKKKGSKIEPIFFSTGNGLVALVYQIEGLTIGGNEEIG